MKTFIGVDGGGTKTAYVVANENNEILFQTEGEGSSYRESSIDTVLGQLRNTVELCLKECNLEIKDCSGVVIGLPCYGESEKEDTEIDQKMKTVFHDMNYKVVNDVEVGWAGSLNLADGVNIVAGTGSIAFGRNHDKKTARSGGWSTFFSDEGSCYWLGRRTMEYFGKEADGRLEKGPLYDVVMNHYGIKNEFEFIDISENELIPFRDKVAQVQRLLYDAAKLGDKNAIALYEEASNELFLIIQGVVKQLELTGKNFNWSYSGGLFHALEFVLPHLEARVSKLGGQLVKPSTTPVMGAFLLAKEKFYEMD